MLLVFYLNTGMTSVTVPGFKSEKSCEKVLKEFAEQNHELLASWSCIEVK